MVHQRGNAVHQHINTPLQISNTPFKHSLKIQILTIFPNTTSFHQIFGHMTTEFSKSLERKETQPRKM